MPVASRRTTTALVTLLATLVLASCSGSGGTSDAKQEPATSTSTSTASTTTTVPVDGQTLQWCNTWARWLDQRDEAFSEKNFLDKAVEQAPEQISGRMKRYAREVENDLDSTAVELDLNAYWHSTCPGGVNRPGEN